MELFEQNLNLEVNAQKDDSLCIQLSNNLRTELQSYLDPNYNLQDLELDLQGETDFIIFGKEDLEKISIEKFKQSHIQLVYLGPQIADLPDYIYWLPWANRSELKPFLTGIQKFSKSKNMSFRWATKQKNHFLKNLLEFCANNERVTLEDRRWLQESIILMQSQLLFVQNFSELEDVLSKLDLHLRPQLQSLSFKKMSEIEPDGENIFRFGLLVEGQIYLLQGELSKSYFPALILFYSIVKTTEYVISFLSEASESQGKNQLFHSLLQEIPFPLILQSERGELIFHNKEFDQLQLLPRDCLNYNDEEMVNHVGRLFKVTKRSLILNNENCFLFTFFRQENQTRENSLSSSEDLGVISSSIAHELNNPVAGILAASALLELDESIDLSELSKVAEIKNSARRIKQLVDIFLGFSRGRLSETRQASLKDCLSRAFDLLRFRMAEMNATLDFEYKSFNLKPARKVNESIYSMILYLICSEILNQSSHAKLIENRSLQRLNKVVVQEHERYFSLSFVEAKKLHERIVQNKLCHHLLQQELLKMTLQENELMIEFSPLS